MMNKILVAAALGATAVAAQAQSSVVLGGIADAAVRSVSNQGLGSVKSMVSGSNSTSRLFFRGSEDLGGGLSASFHLEHGILLDTGSAAQATQFWDRRATVSLASNSLGELRLGRDFVPSYVNWSRYDPFSYVGAAGANNFISATPNGPIRSAFGANPNTTVRSSNAVQYFLPGGLGGFEGGLLVAPGEGGTAANGQHKVTGGRLGWAGGGFGFSAATTTSENNLTTNGKFKDSAVGGNATVASVRLSAVWRQFKQADSKQTTMLVGAVVPLGNGELKASWVKTDLAGKVGTSVIDANDAQQFAIGYVHGLSKRTALYAHLSRIDNDGAATYVVPGGAAGIAGGKTSTGYEFGLRHSF
jgi:predicted porin